MTDRKDHEYYRRQERLDVYRRLPLVVLIFSFTAWMYYISSVDSLVVHDIKLLGPAKFLWALVVELFAGLALLFGVSSLSFLFWVGAAAKGGDYHPHPWMPLIISGVFLTISFGFCLLAYYLEYAVVENVYNINTALRFYDRQVQRVFEIVGGLLWMLVSIVIGVGISSLLFEVLRAPLHAREVVQELKNSADD